MTFFITYFWAFIVGVWFLLYCAFAWLIRTTQKLTAEPPANAVALDMVPKEVHEFAETMIEPLTSLGYKSRGVVRMHDPAAHITNWVLLFFNPESNDYAMSAIVSSTQEGAEDIKASFVEFTTRFSNGDTVDTNNISTLLPYPAAKTHTKTILPDLSDLKQLHAVHQFVLKRTAKDTGKICNIGDSAARFIVDELRKSYEQQAERGLYYLDEKEKVYIPTWKGALLMAFMLMWPVTVIRRMIIKSNAQRVMAQCVSSLGTT